MDRRPSTLNLQKQFENLQKQYSALEQKQQQTHSSLLKFQTKAQEQERELSIYKKSQEKIAIQKEELEKTNSQHKTYIRKLETRLAQGAKGQHLVEVNNLLREQMTEIKDEKQSQIQKMEKLQTQVQQLNDQIKVLTTALELKAEDFNLEGEFRTSLLYDVGHSRQELVKMKEMFNKLKKDNESLRNQLSTALTNIEELKIIRESNNQELIKLELQLQEQGTKTQSTSSNLNKLVQERLSLLDQIKEYQEEKIKLEEKCQEYQEQSDLLEKDYNQFKSFMQSTIQNLQKDNQKLYDENAKTEEKLKQKLYEEKQFKVSQEELYQELDKITYAKNQLQEQNQALQEQLKLSIKINDELKQALQENEKDKQDLEKDLDSALNELKQKRQVLEISKKDQETSESMLKEKLEKTLVDLEDMAQEKEKIKKVLQETVNQYTEVVQEQQALQQKYENALLQIKQIKQQKDILQKSLTDQINTLNAKIQELKEDRNEIEEQNTDLQVQINSLQGTIKQEQKKAKQLYNANL